MDRFTALHYTLTVLQVLHYTPNDTTLQVRGQLGAGGEQGGGGAAHRQGQVSGRALGEPAALPLPRTRLLVTQHIIVIV